jgi:ribosome-binding protein aMBF1 (putative translation factor)
VLLIVCRPKSVKSRSSASVRRTTAPPSARLIFSGNVRALRLERGISQEKLAELTGLHRTYVGSVERGERNVSIDNMDRFAKALGVELLVLVKR